eukprot:317078_1
MAAVNDDKKTNDTENKSKDIENELKDDENQMNSPYHNAFCKFEDFCKIAHKTLTSETINISKSNEWKDPDDITYNEVTECGFLSKWIYDKTKYRFLLKDIGDEMIYKESEKCQTATWSIILNKKTKSLYIAFKGTGSPKGDTLGIDILQDISIIPSPIWVADDKINPDDIKKKDEDDDKSNDWIDLRKNHHHRFDFAVHSGMYAAVQRNFGTILQDGLRPHNTSFNKLYITGHSLGGGLGILFGLELLLRNLIPDRVIAKVIVFGAPNVVSLEYEVPTHRIDAAQVLSQLHSMTHCFVNKFDIVSRIPSPWILEILLPTIPIIIGGALKDSAWSGWASISSSLMEHFGGGVIDSLKQQFMKHQQMLNTFGPFGTYYIILHDSQSNCYIIDDSADNGTIKQILSFIPPIRKNKGLAIKNTENIFAHYYYKQLLGVTSDALQVKLLMQQRRVQFDKAVWKVQCEFNDMPSQYYNTLQTYLFTQRDLYKLIQDHFMDNYLEGLTAHDCKDKIVLTQLKCLKLFNIGCETHTGDKIWENVDKGKYSWNSKTCGSLRVQSRIYNQFFSKFNPNALHSDKYRLTMKSNVFTENKIKDVCHSNDQNVVVAEFNRIKQLMEYWES